MSFLDCRTIHCLRWLHLFALAIVWILSWKFGTSSAVTSTPPFLEQDDNDEEGRSFSSTARTTTTTTTTTTTATSTAIMSRPAVATRDLVRSEFSRTTDNHPQTATSTSYERLPTMTTASSRKTVKALSQRQPLRIPSSASSSCTSSQGFANQRQNPFRTSSLSSSASRVSLDHTQGQMMATQETISKVIDFSSSSSSSSNSYTKQEKTSQRNVGEALELRRSHPSNFDLSSTKGNKGNFVQRDQLVDHKDDKEKQHEIISLSSATEGSTTTSTTTTTRTTPPSTTTPVSSSTTPNHSLPPTSQDPLSFISRGRIARACTREERDNDDLNNPNDYHCNYYNDHQLEETQTTSDSSYSEEMRKDDYTTKTTTTTTASSAIAVQYHDNYHHHHHHLNHNHDNHYNHQVLATAHATTTTTSPPPSLAFVGTILNVYQQESLQPPNGDDDDDDGYGSQRLNSNEPKQQQQQQCGRYHFYYARLPACNEDHDKQHKDDDIQSNNFILEDAYELLEPLHLELGIIPRHALDFAYTPFWWTKPHQQESHDDPQDESGGGRGGATTTSVHQRPYDHDDDSYALGTLVKQSDTYRKISDDNTNIPPSFGQEQQLQSQPLVVSSLQVHSQKEDKKQQQESQDCTAIVPDVGTRFFSSNYWLSSVLFSFRSKTSSSSSSSSPSSSRSNWWQWWFPFTTSSWWKDHGHDETDYNMGSTAFAGGSHGDVWRGRRHCKRKSKQRQRLQNNNSNKQSGSHDHERADILCNDEQSLVLKRLKVEQRGYKLLEAGLREVYYGTLLGKTNSSANNASASSNKNVSTLFTTYVDHFFRHVPTEVSTSKQANDDKNGTTTNLELWIVYEDAGPSLRSYLYTPVTTAGGFVMYQHSPLWTQLRMSASSTSSSDLDNVGEEELDTHDLDNDDDYTPHLDPYHILREILRQVLTAAAALHEQGIVHRDIKPSNVMCTTNIMDLVYASGRKKEHGRSAVSKMKTKSTTSTSSHAKSTSESQESHQSNDAAIAQPTIQCVLGDFSSAWNNFTSQHLYTNGPSPEEQTDEYAPPESYHCTSDTDDQSYYQSRYQHRTLHEEWKWVPFHKAKPQSYDSWSIGVLALELLLGTPNVFSVDQRTTVLLTTKMKKEGASSEEIQRALYLAALSQFCIYTPVTNKHIKTESNSQGSQNSNKRPGWPLRNGDPLYNTAMVKESCTLQDFHRALRARDPLGTGFDSKADLLLHLIWQLLAWDPMDRVAAADALEHPFFGESGASGSTSTTCDHGSSKGTENSNAVLIPGWHNALESQSLDPRMDFNLNDTVKEFTCPKCGRTFQDWRSCKQHATGRKHAKFCVYDISTADVPLQALSCINAHSMLPAHPTSGYCDLQGRRRVIEDFHSIHLHPTNQFYGMFDGHTGNLASKYVASTMYSKLAQRLSNLNRRVMEDLNSDGDSAQNKSGNKNGREKRDASKTSGSNDGSCDINTRPASSNSWKEEVERNVTQAFEDIHERFMEEVSVMATTTTTRQMNPTKNQNGKMSNNNLDGRNPAIDQSGTTATALFVTEEAAVIASLGDSRAILSSISPSRSTGSSRTSWSVSPIQLTKDHVASDPSEQELVEHRGGFISYNAKGTIARVNGTLAITRSIGDANLAPVLSRKPHVVSMTRSEITERCNNSSHPITGNHPVTNVGDSAESMSHVHDSNETNHQKIPCFVILASDGLWDVVTNQEAVDMVAQIIESYYVEDGVAGRTDSFANSHESGTTSKTTDRVSWNNGGAFQQAAESLAIEAYVRGSTDNIGVCVVAI